MVKDKGQLIATMRYKDAPAAIVWLCRVLGFQLHVCHEAGPGIVANAQLIFGNCMIMLSTQRETSFDRLVGTPQDTNGLNTQSLYLIIEDVEAHHDKAVGAGAEIVIPLKEESFGGKSYTCRDPEGYIWNFGSYNPWI